MRTGAAAGTEGYFHEAAFYGSDEELLALVLPFLADGVAAGEPTFVTLGEANSALVRSALSSTTGISFVPGETQYARPAAAIRSYQELLDEHTNRGAGQIRIVGDVPHPGLGAAWGWWARYEAAVNKAYDAYPIWGVCPYDTRTTPEYVLADVVRTHPRLATVDGQHVTNPDFADPVAFLTDLMNRPLPPEPGVPVADLVDPTAATARHAVNDVGGQSEVSASDVQDLAFAVSEAVDNAAEHGAAPTRLRMWNHRDRLVAHITDSGTGPADPYAGLVRAHDTLSAGGVGLWLTHQMCADVTMHRHHDGFTLRVTAGVPTPADLAPPTP